MFGAETTECDSPISLVNATFQWINDNLKDSLDFVVWTGDSARHDNDKKIPRTEKEIVDLNEMVVSKFTEVFGKDDNIHDTDPTNDYIIPIVPTFGNNDIMPHNILTAGPNRWTKHFSHIWRSLIPEEQRHTFERGGWFFVEVIPNKLAVFSLNTLYFFHSNSAVDGCGKKSEPGYEHFEWLRVQLQFIRERGMKAILTGHVPPARTKNKMSWDESCWQKYALWMRQYRDVIVGSVYGHKNIDHFMLQDFRELRKRTKKGRVKTVRETAKRSLGDELTVQSSYKYLTELREDWARIPSRRESTERLTWIERILEIKDVLLRRKKRKSKEDKYLERIGGEWAERYSVSLVTASVVPNYFPSFRVIEYDITGLDNHQVSKGVTALGHEEHTLLPDNDESESATKKKARKNKKRKKKKHRKHPNFSVPSPPSKSSPPGPAYSPQLFTWTSYAQYFANLTRINREFQAPNPTLTSFNSVNDDGGNPSSLQPRSYESKDEIRKPKHGQDNTTFTYEIEYDTKDDKIFVMPDLTTRSWLNLARRIGKYKPKEDFILSNKEEDEEQGLVASNEDKTGSDESGQLEAQRKKHKNKKKKKHHHSRKTIEELWFTFLCRAYVGTKDKHELRDHFAKR